ncbi:MAG: 1-acyl-sn-glycerol-3-phosphate acyltransferase [Bacteroidales bacterium]|nr:1-acyl-sn-glycerol-3-phosphate acyltransferase [Bacteroidales bacterium]
MGIKNIEKFSYRFYLLKFYVKFWHDKIFYKRVTYVNRQKVPRNEHLIFTANHQNALMDALAIEFSLRNQFVFVARSDIFKRKFIAGLLYFLKILPVYRIRDGYDSLKKNQEIFQKTMDVIQNKNGFVIMPEGDHAGFRRLRRLRKGFARIAFQAEEATDYSLNIKIVPVGITYNNYESYRTDLLVVFGDPISLSEYYDDYKENQAVAFNRLTEHLSEKMRPLMIEIASVEDYDVYWGLSLHYRKQACEVLGLKNQPYDKFRGQRYIISKLENFEKVRPEQFSDFAKKVKQFQGYLKSLKLDSTSLSKKNLSFVSLLLRISFLITTAPIFFYGYINNILPYYLPIFAAKKIPDVQFRSSFKFVLSLFLFPVFYLIQVFLIGKIFHWGWPPAVYFVSLPLAAAFAWNYAKFYKRTINTFRRFIYKFKKNKDFEEARNLQEEISTMMEKILVS